MGLGRPSEALSSIGDAAGIDFYEKEEVSHHHISSGMGKAAKDRRKEYDPHRPYDRLKAMQSALGDIAGGQTKGDQHGDYRP